MTYYEILGVTKDAAPDAIKRAYRKLASQHHPDKGGDKNKFQEIQVAYDTLSDPTKRQQYDMQQNGFGGTQFHFHSGDMHHPDISEIFRNFGFGAPFEFHQRPQQRRNKDLRIELPVPLVSTLEDQSKTIQVKTTNGDTTTVEVKIPRGVTNGTNIKYSGLGDNLFNTIPRGDLYVQINVHNAENFIINGVDLHTTISVNCLLATVGGKVAVTGLDNKKFELTLPAGTQPGMKFRLAEQGLYLLNSTHRGDLYVELAVIIPQNLSTEEIDLIRSILNTQ
jgi:DnaJ-class molecular chaperone